MNTSWELYPHMEVAVVENGDGTFVLTVPVPVPPLRVRIIVENLDYSSACVSHDVR